MIKRRSSAQGMVEYIIITGLIALSSVAIVKLYGEQIKNQFSMMTKSVSGETVSVDQTIAEKAEKEEQLDSGMDEYRVSYEGEENKSASPASTTKTSDPSTSTKSIREILTNADLPVPTQDPEPPKKKEPAKPLYKQTFDTKYVNNRSLGYTGSNGCFDISFNASGTPKDSQVYINGSLVGDVAQGQNNLRLNGDCLSRGESNTIEIRSSNGSDSSENATISDFNFSGIVYTS